MFVGDKIKMDRILNIEIVIHGFKIDDSKHKENTKCLTLQIEKSGNKHVVFSGSKILMQMIQKVPKDSFPFTTTIVKHNEYLQFT